MPWSNQSGGGGGPGVGRRRRQAAAMAAARPLGRPPVAAHSRRISRSCCVAARTGSRTCCRAASGIGPRGIAFIVVGLSDRLGLTGWYRVQPDEVGVNIVFGKFTSMTRPGLNYN